MFSHYHAQICARGASGCTSPSKDLAVCVWGGQWTCPGRVRSPPSCLPFRYRQSRNSVPIEAQSTSRLPHWCVLPWTQEVAMGKLCMGIRMKFRWLAWTGRMDIKGKLTAGGRELRLEYSGGQNTACRMPSSLHFHFQV